MRAFILRLGYLLAAEYQFMPPCEFRDSIGNYAHDLIELAERDDPEPPGLHAV